MITIETKYGPVDIDETMRGPAIKAHTKARKIESKSDWQHVKKLAAGVQAWWNENNGKFPGAWESGYAIHHAQVEPYADVWSFFVVDQKLTRKEFAKTIAKRDRSVRDVTNIIFPAQVIYNPEIITATQTFMDDAIGKKGERYKKAIPNVMRYDEGCMSYTENSRSAKKMSRFYRIKVRYQIIKPVLFGLSEKVETIEEWCQGLKAHIFQHECDHSNGVDIYHGDIDGHKPTIEEREMEDGYTRAQVEEYTRKKREEVEAKIQERGMCLLQSVANGRYYRTPTDLEELPDGFIEPDVLELYNLQTGEILPPHDQAPMYTDPSAFDESLEEDLSASENKDEQTIGKV